MLHDFLTENRTELIKRCREKSVKRLEPAKARADVEHGVPQFLRQLTDTLRSEQSTSNRKAVETAQAPLPVETGSAAALHGAEMLRRGLSIDQVVHQYGDVCQSITELAVEQDVHILTDEFRTLNRCLDDAIADAVTAFGHAGQSLINGRAAFVHDRVNAFADEYQRLVDIAIQSFSAIKTGKVGLNGATGALLTHTLSELHDLAERALPEMRPAAAPPVAPD